tara:strand:+ start:41 stop:829 length:789 start_codon:yes stop_codon:yes gene_type:complete
LEEISFSIEVAETIGLRNAVILAILRKKDYSNYSKDELFEIIQRKASFLNEQEIRSSLNRLINLNLLDIKDTSDNLYTLKLPGKNTVRKDGMLVDKWIPSKDVFDVLAMGGIKKDFIENKLREFKLYWKEKNAVKDNWSITFVNFIRREWISETSGNGNKPTLMDNTWVPAEDALEILEMANISNNQAMGYLKEFILYWQETGIALKSWNVKFIDFVRRKEKMGSYNLKDEKNQRHNEPGEYSEEFKTRIRNKSWAEQLDLE